MCIQDSLDRLNTSRTQIKNFKKKANPTLQVIQQ